MEHLDFKEHQTAAAYVAKGLNETEQEAFEMHLMGCPECVEDVEVWRAIKLDMPKQRPDVRSVVPRHRFVLMDWPMAASLVGVGIAGAVGGWVGRATTTPDLDSTRTVVFNLPSISRGDDCVAIKFASNTELALLRVPWIPHDARLVALDSEKRELSAGQYSSRIQPDGSFLVRMKASLLEARVVNLELRRAGGLSDPLGCITGETPEPRK